MAQVHNPERIDLNNDTITIMCTRALTYPYVCSIDNTIVYGVFEQRWYLVIYI